MPTRDHITTADDTESRLSRLETSQQNTTDAIVGLSKKVDELGTAIARSHRTDWTTIYGGATVLLIVIGAVGKSYISPLEMSLEFGKEEVGRLRGNVDEISDTTNRNRAMIEQVASLMGAKLTEVETQFDWLNDIVNMRDRNFHMFQSIIWEEEFGKPLPQPTLPDAGPGSHSRNRSQNNGLHP